MYPGDLRVPSCSLWFALSVISFSVAFWIENKEGFHHEIPQNIVPACGPEHGRWRVRAGRDNAVNPGCFTGATSCSCADRNFRFAGGPPGKPIREAHG